MTILAEVLPTDLALGATFGPDWLNDVVKVSSGVVSVNQRWSSPLHKGQLSYEHLAQADKLPALIAFHMTKAGNAVGWLFFNRRDYKVTGQEIGTGDDAQTTFQLIKEYTSPSGQTLTWNITRPIHGTLEVQDHSTLRLDTLKVYFDEVEVVEAGNWSVSNTTGILTFDAPVPDGVVITIDVEYCYPCRFVDPHLPLKFDGIDVSVDGLGIEEVRV